MEKNTEAAERYTRRRAVLEAQKEPTKWQEYGENISVFTPKGVCKKCRRHIGRGIAMHQRKCKG